MKKLIIKYLHSIMVVNVYIQRFQSLDQTFRKLCSSLAFCNFSILVFVRLSVRLTGFRFNFLLFLKIFALTLYLENLMIMGRRLLLSSFRLPKRCDLMYYFLVNFFKDINNGDTDTDITITWYWYHFQWYW